VTILIKYVVNFGINVYGMSSPDSTVGRNAWFCYNWFSVPVKDLCMNCVSCGFSRAFLVAVRQFARVNCVRGISTIRDNLVTFRGAALNSTDLSLILSDLLAF